jgi:hypothetical protein
LQTIERYLFYFIFYYCSQEAVQDVLIDTLEPLITDPESVIRQHVASQLVHVSIVCMCKPDGLTVQERMDHPDPESTEFDDAGYEIVTVTVLDYINTLLQDRDLDVRRVAAEALTRLAVQIQPVDVAVHCLPIPLALAETAGPAGILTPERMVSQKKKLAEADQQAEELRVTACNLLAELGGAVSEHEFLHGVTWVSDEILPAVLTLCKDGSFRVRRSAAQALPRILGGCSLEDATERILPAFDALSHDDLYRVRKSTGECLVDMSRSIMILAGRETDPETRDALKNLRRTALIPIADRLIQDSHKVVRQGMMQFLGPFMASFYPYQDSSLRELLPTSTESDGSNHMGIVAQFFPHATSMVSRLNSAQNSVSTAPAPVQPNLQQVMARTTNDTDLLQQAYPHFLRAARMSSLSLQAVTTHRQGNPPDPDDISAIVDGLLDYFAALAIVTTGDPNTDAEMRVYCAYSFPAVVLLLGPENWEGAMKTCFQTLLNPDLAKKMTGTGGDDSTEPPAGPPLPVKRCLASSLNTVAHILGMDVAVADILPVFQGFFLTDPDESVRLNVIRNFPSLLQLADKADRKVPLEIWSEVVRGEEFLGSKKRSASNPVVLNWRQRDYLARSLPDLFGLLEPTLVHEHIWPILQQLLTDSISLVREDAMWSFPILLKSLCPENCKKWGVKDSKRFSSDVCAEVTNWLKETVLRIGAPRDAKSKLVNFNDRQLYCRICATIGLALRYAEILDGGQASDPVSVLGEKFKPYFSGKTDYPTDGPYQKLTAAEVSHLKALLNDDLLPQALEMKHDRISNVRITLMQTLNLMPLDIKESAQCAPVLKGLKEEVATWESFVGEEEQQAKAQADEKIKAEAKAKRKKAPSKPKPKTQQIHRKPGPVDVDDVELTPQNSKDDSSNSDDDPAMEPERPASDSSEEPEKAGHDDSSDSDSSSAEDKDPSASPSDAAASSETDLKTVIFEAGPIGMQLEPTAEDQACRVYGFVDGETGDPSQARTSGEIKMGDVIVSVNGTVPESYEGTIELLKEGGTREIVFRAGTEADDYDEIYTEDIDDGSDDSGSSDEEKKKSKKKDGKKEKKAKKEKKPKKEKKAKKDKSEDDSKKEKKKDKDKSEDDGKKEKKKDKEKAEDDSKKEKKKDKDKSEDDGKKEKKKSDKEKADDDSKKEKKKDKDKEKADGDSKKEKKKDKDKEKADGDSKKEKKKDKEKADGDKKEKKKDKEKG